MVKMINLITCFDILNGMDFQWIEIVFLYTVVTWQNQNIPFSSYFFEDFLSEIFPLFFSFFIFSFFFQKNFKKKMKWNKNIWFSLLSLLVHCGDEYSIWFIFCCLFFSFIFFYFWIFSFLFTLSTHFFLSTFF